MNQDEEETNGHSVLTVEREVAMKPELKVPLAKLKGTTLLSIDCAKKN